MRISRWDEVSSCEHTNEVLLRLSTTLAARLGDADTRTRVTHHIRGGDLRSLCDLDCDYGRLSVYDASLVRQISAFFSKRGDLKFEGVDPQTAAFASFLESERTCREVNEQIILSRSGAFQYSPLVSAAIFAARRKISSVLGPVPDLQSLRFRFGPGATTQVPKRKASSRLKLAQTFACSEDLLPVVRQVLEEMPCWLPEPSGASETVTVPVEIHRGRLSFVPKSWKTKRTIVVEPSLNQMVQLGIGDYMARRLLRVGIDIRNQDRNKVLAREGSITGALATLDLSSASDSIAYELVYELLPVDWALFLSPFRSGSVELKHKGRKAEFKLQKFSSMGNGFTFPLETLIFWSLASAVTPDGVVSVYGDDIIVPTESFSRLCEVLRCLGFTPNLKKSFASGPFRESCGGDYLSGIDIRPLYIKGPLHGYDLFRMHNHFFGQHDEELCEVVLEYLAPHLQRWGPQGYGHGHLWCTDPPFVAHKRHLGWSGYTFETYTLKPRWDFKKYLPGDHVLPSYSTYLREGASDCDFDLPLLYAMKGWDPDHDVESPASGFRYKHGELGVSIPGTKGVNLIKIYVL